MLTQYPHDLLKSSYTCRYYPCPKPAKREKHVLRQMDIHDKLFSHFYRFDNFFDFLFAFTVMLKPFLKRVFSRKKRVCSQSEIKKTD